MKKIFLILTITAVAVAMSACNQPDERLSTTDMNSLQITAEQGTKAVMGALAEGEYPISFETDDKCTLFSDTNSTGVDYLYSSASAGVSTFTTDGADPIDGTSFTAIFPTAATNTATTVTLPEVQTYNTDSFAKDATYMVGTSTGNTFAMKHLCGLWKFNLVGERAGDKVVSVKFSIGSGNICGKYAISWNGTEPVLTYTSDGKSSVTLNYAAGVELSTASPTAFYITLPAGSYSGGFSVEATLSDGRKMTKTSAATVNISRARITSSVTNVSYSSFGGGDGTQATPYLIKTAEQWNNFTLLVNAGTTFAGQYVALNNDINFANATLTPVGKTSTINFKGTFDGRNHKLSNAAIGSSASNSVGLFVAMSGTVKKLNIDKFTVTAGGATISRSAVLSGGEVAGSIVNCTVTNSSVTAPNTQNNGYNGILVAQISYTTGLVDGCTVDNCTLVCHGDMAGGIAGAMTQAGTIKNCIVKNTSITTDRRYVGGIVGTISAGTIINNISDGNTLTVKVSHSGGIIGYISGTGNCMNNLVKGGTTVKNTATTPNQFIGLVSGGDVNSATGFCKNNFVRSGYISYVNATPACVGLISGRRLASTMLAHNYYSETLVTTANLTNSGVSINSVGYTYNTATPTVLGINTQGGSVAVTEANATSTDTSNASALINILNGNIANTYTTATYPDIATWVSGADGWPTFDFE